jgi:GNAT superfamily N-acetyltransferase
MQNKRGIAQAFAHSTTGLVLRPATVFDVFDLSTVLCSSIRDLCSADHNNDPQIIALWTANKTPESLRRWFAGEHAIWLAILNGRAAGVGAVSPTAEISVLYVAPQAVGQGVGTALLAKLESIAKNAGHQAAHLSSTATAYDFYVKQRWTPAGSAEPGRFGPSYPMQKKI